MSVILIPPGDDLAGGLARHLLDRHGPTRPDWSALTLIAPSAAGIAALRRALLREAGPSLGPTLLTLGAFAEARGGGERPLSALECRLILTEALRRHRGLLPGVDRGRAAAALFELFEDMSAHAVDPGADEAAFAARVQRAYAADAGNAWMSREAQMVQRLWLAFGEATAGRSPAATYRRHLEGALRSLRGEEHLYVAGLDAFDAGEIDALGRAAKAGRAELWLQGRLEGHDGAALRELCARLGATPGLRASADPRSRLLDAAFSTDAEPARHPAVDSLRIVAAANPEHEARCVELAVRQALLAGAGQVAVLAEDRRLARRLRALLERAGLTLDDRAGWALSTSSAAATLDAWLQCLESGFQFRPLLELLKSGFMDPPPEALVELERDLVYGRAAIEGGLSTLLARAKSAALQDLLRTLQQAAIALPRGTAPADRWMALLLGSLRRLPVWEALLADPAGERLTGVLLELETACTRVPLDLAWPQLRELIDRAIETETFVPEPAGGPVRLVNLAQAQLERPDVLIVAGATREQLPGGTGATPFFNAAVRRELGLPSFLQRRDLALLRLRRALECAPRVLVTYAPATADEPAQLSPWLEAVETQAEGSLRDGVLARLAADPATELALADGTVAPPTRPAPRAVAAMLPARLSASAHQALIDCPYRFFAGSLLGLRAEAAPDEDPDRSDYGERVHAILQAFTSEVAGRPAPFGEAVTPQNRARAEAKLLEIADAVLKPDLTRRALAQTWLAEFRAGLPRLLDWLQSRPALSAVAAEVELEREFAGLRLGGRADRLETRHDGSRAVIDYKTGSVPGRDAVESGEQVQLLHYALLDPEVVAVEYLALKKKEESYGFEKELGPLRESAGLRLDRALRRLQAGAPLPAHGDEPSCERCDYGGLCRRADWSA